MFLEFCDSPLFSIGVVPCGGGLQPCVTRIIHSKLLVSVLQGASERAASGRTLTRKTTWTLSVSDQTRTYPTVRSTTRSLVSSRILLTAGTSLV